MADIKITDICIIIPTYNNEKTLADVLQRTSALGFTVFVINDGSTDDTTKILETFASVVNTVSYRKNKGKGYALRKGFAEAREQGFSYAITMDSDGQHNPDDILLFVEKLIDTGESVILGVRKMPPDVPAKSAFGKKFSNFWFFIETRIKCKDTQTGFRVYPLKSVVKKRFFTNRFEFEIESIVRLAWEGVPVKEIDVSVVYFSETERVSHFRPCRDFLRISVLNTVLVIAAYLWFLPRRFFIDLRKKTWKEILLNTKESNLKKAESIAFGVFMGILPVWGFQMALAFALAIPLKLNKTLVLIASNISLPPMIPFIIYGSLLFGGLLFGDENILKFNVSISFKDIENVALLYVTGSIIFAFLSAVLVFVVSYFLLKIIRRQ